MILDDLVQNLVTGYEDSQAAQKEPVLDTKGRSSIEEQNKLGCNI